MSALEIASVVASVVSVALALVAIWLSIKFYQMSNELQVSSKQAADSLISNVGKLEDVFNRLYSDTFEMMGETYSDMRKHVWPDQAAHTDAEQNEKKDWIEARFGELQTSLEKRMSAVFARQHDQDTKLEGIRDELRQELRETLAESREMMEADVPMGPLRHLIISFLRRRGRTTARRIIDHISAIGVSPAHDAIAELGRLRQDGLVSWQDDVLDPDTIVKVQPNLFEPALSEDSAASAGRTRVPGKSGPAAPSGRRRQAGSIGHFGPTGPGEPPNMA